MRKSEFVDVAKLVSETWWSFPIPDEALDRLYRELADLDQSQVLAAVAALGERERPPTAAMIRAKVLELADDAPAWGDVLAALRRRADPLRLRVDWACPDGTCDGSGWVMSDGDDPARQCACRPAMIAARRRAAALHPLVREFMERIGWAEARDAAGDRTAQAQVREKYRAFLAERREDAVLALADPEGLPRVARARRRAPEALRAALRRVLPGGDE